MAKKDLPLLAVVMEKDQIERLELPEFHDLMLALKDHRITLKSFAGYISGRKTALKNEQGTDMYDDTKEVLREMYRNFQKAFQEATGIGVSLQFHNGKKVRYTYDQEDGAFFALNFHQVFDITPNANALLGQATFGLAQYAVQED